jgi:uncharacterized protein YukE
VQVKQSVLDNAARKATTVGEGIALNLSRLLNEIELQAPGFKGGAGSAFFVNTQGIGEELRGIIEALNEMADSIGASNQLYGFTDQDAMQEINQVAGQYLPGNQDVTTVLRG